MPMESTSGMRKFVRTPATLISAVASRGNPPASTPTSLVVPPMSTTAHVPRPESSAAPRIELVGPEAKVATG
jgi:hypothetical protein